MRDIFHDICTFVYNKLYICSSTTYESNKYCFLSAKKKKKKSFWIYRRNEGNETQNPFRIVLVPKRLLISAWTREDSREQHFFSLIYEMSI